MALCTLDPCQVFMYLDSTFTVSQKVELQEHASPHTWTQIEIQINESKA